MKALGELIPVTVAIHVDLFTGTLARTRFSGICFRESPLPRPRWSLFSLFDDVLLLGKVHCSRFQLDEVLGVRACFGCFNRGVVGCHDRVCLVSQTVPYIEHVATRF